MSLRGSQVRSSCTAREGRLVKFTFRISLICVICDMQQGDTLPQAMVHCSAIPDSAANALCFPAHRCVLRIRDYQKFPLSLRAHGLAYCISRLC